VTEVPTEDVVVTRGVIGICHMQVCAYGETPPERVEERANQLNPTGISSRWKIVTGEELGEENLAPAPCEQFRGRIHYLLSC
jgi:hypothetical protein